MVQQPVKITNETGLHARPASMLVQTANNFESEIKLIKGKDESNAKSIMGIMSLAITKDTEVVIQADGSDEKEAVKKLASLIESGFGE
ncbi:MAG: phosphotransferase system HPr (HPr) family protein [Candidatus Frackibacter sp. T328-2]|nr:MAG: phosphotransferase system HPr (HPr) family protein [Candidatus Frackibacter sp. T328-2]